MKLRCRGALHAPWVQQRPPWAQQRPPWAHAMRPYIILAVTWLVLAACGEQSVNYPTRQPPAGVLGDTTQIDLGKVLFHEICASCHGKPSEGRSERASFFNPPAPDFSEERYLGLDPAYLFWRIEIGKTVEPWLSSGSVMPTWRGLSDQEIWQLVAYLQTRAK